MAFKCRTLKVKIIPSSLLLRMRKVSEKVAEKIKTNFMCRSFFPPENRALYEIMWKNMVEPDRPQISTWRLRVAC
jgi:hypothetical protein